MKEPGSEFNPEKMRNLTALYTIVHDALRLCDVETDKVERKHLNEALDELASLYPALHREKYDEPSAEYVSITKTELDDLVNHVMGVIGNNFEKMGMSEVQSTAPFSALKITVRDIINFERENRLADKNRHRAS